MGAAKSWQLQSLFLLAGLHSGQGDGLFDGLWDWSSDVPREAAGSRQGAVEQYLSISYNRAMQPLVEVIIGGQPLDLVFDASSGNTFVFVKEQGACDSAARCYSYNVAARAGTGAVRICMENQDTTCENGRGNGYLCRTEMRPSPRLEDEVAHADSLVIDGLQYNLKGIEAKDVVEVKLYRITSDGHKRTYQIGLVPWQQLREPSPDALPIRLLMSKFEVPRFNVPGASWTSPLRLFEGTSGLLGASGVSLSCRRTSIWQALVESRQVTAFGLDLHPPESARFAYAAAGGRGGLSRVILNPALHNSTVWSEPKQTNDFRFEGMNQFMLYHPTVCGADLLYGRSSNWLAIIDTSGPCLSLPPFFFDSLMTHIPVRCPFAIGERSLGRLCVPDRTRARASTFQTSDGPVTVNVSLPTLWFQLRDERGKSHVPSIPLPLERLVFDAEGGLGELLCIARSDFDSPETSLDMMYSHIGFGSLAVSAVYTEVDLINNRTGLRARSNAGAESTDSFCAEKLVCISPMQKYNEATNRCLDPDCTKYMFMYLDHETKMCVWSVMAPLNLGIAIAALVALDFFSHRLYKQATDRAREMCD